MESLNNENTENDCLDVAMKVMKATDEKIFMSPEEETMLADETTRRDLRLLVGAERSMLESGVPLPDTNQELQKITGAKARSAHLYIISALICAAAMLLAVVAFKWITDFAPENNMVAHVRKAASTGGTKTISTSAGETLTLNMADGTSVTLNAGSSLSYPQRFGDGTRTVSLRGEALFKVSKDKAHPFIVHTEKMTTRVLGTTFDIKAYSGHKTSVVLMEGSIEVTAGSHIRRIKPGERAAIANNGKIVVDRVNAEETTAWSDNQFYFDNQRLEDIMDDLGRWYNLTVVYRADSLKDLHLNFATPRNGSADDAIELLNSMRRFKVIKENGRIVVE